MKLKHLTILLFLPCLIVAFILLVIFDKMVHVAMKIGWMPFVGIMMVRITQVQIKYLSSFYVASILFWIGFISYLLR